MIKMKKKIRGGIIAPVAMPHTLSHPLQRLHSVPENGHCIKKYSIYLAHKSTPFFIIDHVDLY